MDDDNIMYYELNLTLEKEWSNESGGRVFTVKTPPNNDKQGM